MGGGGVDRDDDDRQCSVEGDMGDCDTGSKLTDTAAANLNSVAEHCCKAAGPLCQTGRTAVSAGNCEPRGPRHRLSYPKHLVLRVRQAVLAAGSW